MPDELIFHRLVAELGLNPRPGAVPRPRPTPRPAPRHVLTGHLSRTQELPIMGDHHDDNGDGVADQVAGCCGENRSDPDDWSDPDILDEPWQAPVDVEAEG